jgi:hypothetical protein
MGPNIAYTIAKPRTYIAPDTFTFCFIEIISIRVQRVVTTIIEYHYEWCASTCSAACSSPSS